LTTTQNKQQTLVVILGPTGVGKTAISLKIAKLFSCPIISSDSRQFYRELKIGTAAPTENELKEQTHYFIGSHSIHDNYNAGQYEADALALLQEVFQQKNVALLVGGSMMYIDALCKGIDEMPTVDEKTRNFWKNIYEQKGLEYIQNELLMRDPVHFAEIDIKNHKRILHALEICSITGKPYSDIRTGIIKTRPFKILKIGLNRPRNELYDNINKRVEAMMTAGLLDEAIPLFSFRNLNSLNTVGYKEIFSYLSGGCSLESAIGMIQQNSRRYAKRQLTWFNRDTDIHWFHPDDENEILNFVTQQVAHKL